MTERTFEYDTNLLIACAHSPLAAFLSDDDVQAPAQHLPHDETANDACSVLHRLHAVHYGNPEPTSYERHHDGYRVDHRLRRFVRGVLMVHNHNTQAKQLHQVTLNQFADSDFRETLENFGDACEGLELWDSIEKELHFSTDNAIQPQVEANLGTGHGGLHHLHKHKRRKKRQEEEAQKNINLKLKFPDKHSNPQFAVPAIDDPAMDGNLVKLKPRNRIVFDQENPTNSTLDAFAIHLNWATEENPDGVAIVKDAFDQEECGSCWAYCATGSLEASASRQQARDAYNDFMLQNTPDRAGAGEVEAVKLQAVQFAQTVEQAAFRMTNLSIQELLDCDTAADQGCTGGNPLLAFFFIHRYGLTSWSRYPYVGYEDKCHGRWVSHPVAKVKAWGIVSPNHENDMELVIRHIGPVAVGINGGEASFLAYQRGIFDKPNCRQGANHALLVVGYGQERMVDGEIVKYWIARNSWGVGWGENGYIRIKRGDGRKGSRSVCGISRNPSVALGGVLLANRHKLEPYHTPTPWVNGTRPLSSRTEGGFCSRNGLCTRIYVAVEDHKAFFMGLLAIVCAVILAVYPLTLQYRRRRHRRRLRQQQNSERLRLSQRGSETEEERALLAENGNVVTYTTG